MQNQGTEAQVARAPAPFLIGGKEYWATPLSDLDIMELDQWVQSLHIDKARASCRLPGVTAEERELTMKVALLQSLSLTWYSGIGAKLMMTTEGISRIVWQSLKRKYPELTLEQVRDSLRDNAEAIRYARERFDEINSLPSDRQESEATNPADQAQNS